MWRNKSNPDGKTVGTRNIGYMIKWGEILDGWICKLCKKQGEKAEKLSFCRGIKLIHIRDKVETMLGFIGKGGIFEEYTFTILTIFMKC